MSIPTKNRGITIEGLQIISNILGYIQPKICGPCFTQHIYLSNIFLILYIYIGCHLGEGRLTLGSPCISVFSLCIFCSIAYLQQPCKFPSQFVVPQHAASTVAIFSCSHVVATLLSARWRHIRYDIQKLVQEKIEGICKYILRFKYQYSHLIGR